MIKLTYTGAAQPTPVYVAAAHIVAVYKNPQSVNGDSAIVFDTGFSLMVAESPAAISEMIPDLTS